MFLNLGLELILMRGCFVGLFVPLFSLVLSYTLPSMSNSLCSSLASSQEPGLMSGLLLCGNITLSQKQRGSFSGGKDRSPGSREPF